MGAARNVTGSRYLIEAGDRKVLVDCGLYQERQFQYRNWEPFPTPPGEIGAVLLTHAHLDHCGLLPKLVREGFRGPVICTAATADITGIILLDAARLQEEDAAYKKKRHLKEGRRGPYPEIPLYTVEDAEAVLPLFRPAAYNESVAVAPGIEATFHDAGHVLGSSMIKLVIGQGEARRSIVFSGDIGRWDSPILNDPSVFQKTDYVVMESTYGDRQHQGTHEIGRDVEEIIKSALAAGGNIIVPAFALQRSQEILFYLNDLLMDGRIPELPVYLDSPMAIKIIEVFRRHSELFDRQMKELLRRDHSPFDFPGLRMVETIEESKALNDIKGTAMIIAGSGMCTGGRIKHHLVNNISRPECTIMFTGYQAEGTLGRRIVEGASSVRIHGQPRAVLARVVQVQGFSAHADRDELLRWLSRLTVNPRRIFVTHGEQHAAEQFSRFLREKTGCDIEVPAYRSMVRLD
jgi:metallo-beta-lactamase family protein